MTASDCGSRPATIDTLSPCSGEVSLPTASGDREVAPDPFDCPVLLVGFNRPQETRQILQILSHIKPKRLYFAVDGPRENVQDDVRLCSEVKSLASHVTWSCSLFTLFQARNLGCRKNMLGAIDWFFANEVEGIILEDDCHPTQTFFLYSRDLLDYYRENESVGHISGTTFFPDKSAKSQLSFGFSHNATVWGWATWRDRWQRFRVADKSRDFFEIKASTIPGGLISRRFWKKALESSELDDTWDYEWQYFLWSKKLLACEPSVNLVTNAGFSATGSHTKKQPLTRRFKPVGEDAGFPLSYPNRQEPSRLRSLAYQVAHIGVAGSLVKSLFRAALNPWQATSSILGRLRK